MKVYFTNVLKSQKISNKIWLLIHVNSKTINVQIMNVSMFFLKWSIWLIFILNVFILSFQLAPLKADMLDVRTY